MPAKRLLAATFAAAFLTVQVALPVIGLFGERPGRFGWQMYSAFPSLPEAWLVRADGTQERVDLGPLFAMQRAEIDYVAALRAGLCDVAGATAIRVVPAEGDPETVPCDG
jgi:hypothetical protein